MKISEQLTNKLFKWVVLYPRFRKFVNWAYSDLMKMPQYHIGLAPGQVGKYVILVDDPRDVEKVAAYFQNPAEVADHREYRTFTGILNGTKASVTSVGLGGPPAAIGVHELAAVGAHAFIYLGCGLAVNNGINNGDLIIAKGAVRDEGTGLQYAPLAFPAVADLHLAECLRNACREQKTTHHVGLTRSTDTYYNIGLEEPDAFPCTLCSDLNSAAILITASVLRKKAAVLLQATDRVNPLSEAQVSIVIAAIKMAIALDGTGK